MVVECKCNDGFEDQLTVGKRYRVVRQGDNGFFLETDVATFGWYGEPKFKIII